MSSEDEPKTTEGGIELPTLEGLLGEGDFPEISFEEHWGDPRESKHTELEAIPERAVIDFGNGVTKDCGQQFLIMRAMVDPDATVLPDGDE